MRALLKLLLLVATLGAGVSPGAALSDQHAAVRIGLTPVFLDEQTALLQSWRQYFEAGLKRPVVFVKRGSYREIVELLNDGTIEFAWLCGFPYVENQKSLALVAVPLYRGKPLYRSYLITRASDRNSRGLADLKNRIFAYSDPDSNSGFLVVQDAVRELGEQPTYFFRRTFFTWAHRKVIEAVAVGLADGGAVDGYVYEALARSSPELVARTRIVSKSREFGFPPFVAHRRVPREAADALRATLLTMADSDIGREILAQLDLDGFTGPQPALFEDIRRMAALNRRAGNAR